MNAPKLANLALTKLINYLKPNAWPNCYATFGDYMFDFWPDLPWDCTNLRIAINALTEDSRFPAVCEEIQRRFDFDFRTVVNKQKHRL